MNLRILTTGLGLATLLTIGLSADFASAQDSRSSVLSRNQRSPNVVYQQGPRTRVYVTRRSWLDLGTEVQPGDRKYTDYAIPPAYTQNTIDQLTGFPWTRQVFPDRFDLPGVPKGGYGY
jgi:hypothetical protein